MEENLLNGNMEFRLRNIPEAIWKEFKIFCLKDDTTPNDKLNRLLKEYVAKRRDKP